MPHFEDLVRKQIAYQKIPVVEFAESDNFCGKALFPHQRVLLKLIFLEEMEGWEEDILSTWIRGGRHGEITISPEIRERREICRERGYDHFSEIDMVGGRRSAKGYVTGLAGAYKLWNVQQIPDLGKFFKMDPDKVIDFSCIAASFDQAKTRQFTDLRSSIVGCKALVPYIGKDLEEILTIRTDQDEEFIQEMKAMGKKVARDFAKLRVTPIAANADTVRGNANIFLTFDEMAFMLPGESRSSAQQCYTAIEPSLAQFGQHALVFANSSPYTRIGQFYEQYELSMRPSVHQKGWYPMRFAIEFPSWALFDSWWLDREKRFERPLMVSPDWADVLEEGNPDSALNDFALEQREAEKLKEAANPDTYRVEYRAQWAEVLDAYLDPTRIDVAFSGFKPDGSPCVQSGGGNYLFDFKAHCDPSSTTAGFGFALAHVEEFPDPSGIFPDGMARHVVFDRVMRWNPSDFPGGTINYIKVREELEWFIQVYQPSELTFDQYNSVGLIQELRQFAHVRNLYSVRVGEIKATAAGNWNRWEAFKTALYLGLIHIPQDCIDPRTGFEHSEYAKQELKFLQEVATGQNKRVEKQDMGPIQTKDIADCIAEVTVKFLGSYLGDFMQKQFNVAKLQTGAEGGYQIGGREQGGPMGGFSPEKGAGHFDQFYGRRGSYNDPSKARGINPRRHRH